MPALVVNLFGGPGSGKSTTAAQLFALLKHRNVNCEVAAEYAKDKVWEGSAHVLKNQYYVFGKQFHRIWRLLNEVDIVITDSPFLLSALYYTGSNPFFIDMVKHEHSLLNSFNVDLKRMKKYQPAGRLQTEDEARALDEKITKLVLDSTPMNCPVYGIAADEAAASHIIRCMELHKLL